jgi:hypothetical protein
MVQKQNLDSEIEYQHQENQKELDFLVRREKKELAELDKLASELRSYEKESKKLIRQTGEDNLNADLMNWITELFYFYTSVEYGDDIAKSKKRKKDLNPIKDLTDALRVSLI